MKQLKPNLPLPNLVFSGGKFNDNLEQSVAVRKQAPPPIMVWVTMAAEALILWARKTIQDLAMDWTFQQDTGRPINHL